jgi:hypothetical protein
VRRATRAGVRRASAHRSDVSAGRALAGPVDDRAGPVKREPELVAFFSCDCDGVRPCGMHGQVDRDGDDGRTPRHPRGAPRRRLRGERNHCLRRRTGTSERAMCRHFGSDGHTHYRRADPAHPRT